MLLLSSASCARQRDPSQIQLGNRLAWHCSQIVLLESRGQKLSTVRELKMPDTYSQREQQIARSKVLGLCSRLSTKCRQTHILGYTLEGQRATTCKVVKYACRAAQERLTGLGCCALLVVSWLVCPPSTFTTPFSDSDWRSDGDRGCNFQVKGGIFVKFKSVY